MKRTLAEINADYEQILHSSLTDYQKTVKFAVLMTELEGSYKVPMLKNQEWENENKAAIALYRKISRSRSFRIKEDTKMRLETLKTIAFDVKDNVFDNETEAIMM